MTRCLDCANLVNRNAAMAKSGLAGCKHHPEWEYRSITKERSCRDFVRASDEVLVTRNDWVAKVGAV